MDLWSALGDPEPFGGVRVLENTIRLMITLVGFTLAGVCVKFTILSFRNGEAFRAWGLGSYGFAIVTPSVSGLFRFDAPLLWPPTITYVLALLCGIMALRKAYTVTPEYIRLRRADRRRREERRRERDAH